MIGISLLILKFSVDPYAVFLDGSILIVESADAISFVIFPFPVIHSVLIAAYIIGAVSFYVRLKNPGISIHRLW